MVKCLESVLEQNLIKILISIKKNHILYLFKNLDGKKRELEKVKEVISPSLYNPTMQLRYT